MVRLVVLLVLYHFHWVVISTLGSIPFVIMVKNLIGLSSFEVFSSLMSTPVIDLLRVSEGTIFFRDSGYSVVFVFLIMLHSLMYVSVLPRDGIFQIIFGTSVSEFATAVADNFISGSLWKIVLEVFHLVQGYYGIGSAFGSHIISYQTCDYSVNIMPPQWYSYIDLCKDKTSTLVPFTCAIIGLIATSDEEIFRPLLKIIIFQSFENKYVWFISVMFDLFHKLIEDTFS